MNSLLGSILKVKLYGEEIGTLTLLSGDRTIFAFSEEYINLSPSSRPKLSQSFISKTQELITGTRPYQTRLMPFFSNLLPEGVLRIYLAERGGVRPEREFFLLKLLGLDLPGAITVEAIDDKTDELETAVQANTKKTKELPLRFSLAGVQLKFSAIAGKNRGLTIPANGRDGNWIVKLPSQVYPHVPENEEAMLFLAREVGITVPEFKLVSINEIEGLPQVEHFKSEKALAVKRFDRADDGGHIHIEDFAQVYGIYPEDKYRRVSYANMANMIYTLGGEQELEEYIKRLVFYILIGNGDMHVKNWSFIYKDKVTPLLSPAYDIVSTICYIPNDQLALKFSVTKEMQKIDSKMFAEMALKAALPNRMIQKVVLDTIEATLTAWNQQKKHLNLSKDITETIETHMNDCMLVQLSK